MAAMNCFFSEYKTTDCKLEVRDTVSDFDNRKVADPAKPNDQLVSIDLAMTGKYNIFLEGKLSVRSA